MNEHEQRGPGDQRGGEQRGVGQLLTDLSQGVTTLFRKEAELIRAELREKITQAEVGAGSIAAGAICLLVALNVLAGALVIALAELIGAGWAALAVGVALAVIGVILLKKGSSDVKDLTPERSVRQASHDAAFVKEQVR
jgi:hypothetical protein